MNDKLGNPLSIGDFVAYARSHYAEIYTGYVIGFTPKGCKVANEIGSPNYVVVFTHQVVKVHV